MRLFREAFPLVFALFMGPFASSLVACPVLEIGPNVTMCEGDSVTFDAGTCWSLILWNTGDNTPTITAKDSGMYVVWVLDSNSNAFYDTVYVSYLAKPNMQVSPAGPVFLCSGESTILDAKDLSVLAYQWSTGSTSAETTVDSTGSYYVIGWNNLGCPDTSDIVFVNVNAPVNLSLGNDTAICPGDQVVLDAGPGFVSYAWSDSNKTRYDTVDVQSAVAVTVTDANGCKGRDTLNLGVFAQLPIDLGSDTTYCAGGLVTLDAGPLFSTYSWSTGDTSRMIDVTSSGVYFVQGTDANGCVHSSATKMVTVISPANATLTFANGMLSTEPGFSHEWLFEGSTLLGETGNTLVPPRRGSFAVVTTDADGCADTSNFLLIDIGLEAADIPEGFSPNGDGVNDEFVIQNLSLFPETSLSIVDRNGSQVFETDDYQNDWDGTRENGESLPAGTYFYVIDPGAGFVARSGYVIINR